MKPGPGAGFMKPPLAKGLLKSKVFPFFLGSLVSPNLLRKVWASMSKESPLNFQETQEVP